MKSKRTGIIAALLLTVAFSVCGLTACSETTEESSYSLSGENVTFTLSGAQADKAKKGDEITVSYDTEFGYDYELTVKSGDTTVTVENGKFTMPSGNVTATLTKTAILYTITAPNTVTFESGVENGKVTVESNVVFSLMLPAETYATAVKVNDTALTEAEGKYSFAANAYLSETVNEIAVTVETDVKVYDLNATGATLKIGGETATSAKKGDNVTIEYETRFGYAYDVSVKCGETDVEVSGNAFEMPAGNVTVTVTETALEYNVTAPQEIAFTSGVSENKTTIEDAVVFTATPAQGYKITGVTVNGSTVVAMNGTYSFDVADYITEDGDATAITIAVTTEKITYTLTAETENVTFKNDSDETITGAHAGEEVTVAYEKTFGYTYTVTVKCGETDVEFADGKFTMPYGNVTVTVEKAANKYNVTASGNELAFTEGVTDGKTTVEATVKFTITTDDTHGVENVKVNGTEITAVQGVYTFAAKDYLNENASEIRVTYNIYNAIKAFSFAGIEANYKQVEVTVEGDNGEQVMLELRNSENEKTDRLYAKISNNTATFDLSGIANLNEKFALAISASGKVATNITVKNAVVNRVNIQDMLRRTTGTLTENGLTLSSGPATNYTDGKLASLRSNTFSLDIFYNGVAYNYFTIETTMLQYCGSGGGNSLHYQVGGETKHSVGANNATYGDTTITDANKVTDIWTCNEQLLTENSMHVVCYILCAGDWIQCSTHGMAYATIGDITFYGDKDLYLGSIRNDNENALEFVEVIFGYSFADIDEAGYKQVEVAIEGTDGEQVMLELRNVSNEMTDRLYATISGNIATFDLSGIENLKQKYAFAVSASGKNATAITVKDAVVNRVNIQDMLRRTTGTLTENGLTLSSGPAANYTDGKLASLRSNTFALDMSYNGVAYNYFTIETTMLQYCGSGGVNSLHYQVSGETKHSVGANNAPYGDTTITDANKVTDIWTCNEQLLTGNVMHVVCYILCAGDWTQCSTHGMAYATIGDITFYGNKTTSVVNFENANGNGLQFVAQE